MKYRAEDPFLAYPHGENADISQRKDVFIGYIVSHVERRAAVMLKGHG